LYGVAFRIARRARAQAARRHHHESQTPPRPPVDTTAEVTGRELGAVLDEELHRLPECYRGPFLLCYVEGQTRDQAARQLGWPLRTRRGRLERGRGLLRTRLARRGVTLSAGLRAAGLSEQAAIAAVPALLASASVKAASVLAAGEPLTTAGISAQAATLAEGV